MISPRPLGPIVCLELDQPWRRTPAHERLELRYGLTEVYDGPTGRLLGVFDTQFRCDAWLAKQQAGSWYRLVRRLPVLPSFALMHRTQSIASVHVQGVIIRQVRRAWSINPSRGDHEPQ